MTVFVKDSGLALPDRYRYWLERTELLGRGLCVFCGLNPSTAGAEVDDPTIRRERGFAARLGHRRMIKLNLFAARATHPRNLYRMDAPVGAGNLNDLALERALRLIVEAKQVGDPSTFICAWGATPDGCAAFREVYAERVARVTSRAQTCGVHLWCLGYTQDGAPRHPLYLASATPLVPFEPGRIAQ